MSSEQAVYMWGTAAASSSRLLTQTLQRQHEGSVPRMTTRYLTVKTGGPRVPSMHIYSQTYS